MTKLTAAEHQAISDAVTAVETTTSAELVTVITPSSDDYNFIPLLWPATIALLVGPAMMLLRPDASLLNVTAIQAGVLIALGLATRWLPLRVWLVPKMVKHRRATLQARAQFLAQNVHLSRDHTGVLIFVSLAERYVEIIADKGINDKVDPHVWSATIDTFRDAVKAGNMVEGLLKTIADCGAVLAQHCPPSPDDINELPNHPIELD